LYEPKSVNMAQTSDAGASMSMLERICFIDPVWTLGVGIAEKITD
jgi:hypothetical protein